jgi:type III pantothenate kinase
MSAENFPLVAVDVGNSRIKLGLFDESAADASQPGLPTPSRTFDLGPEAAELDRIAEWIGPDRVSQMPWWIGSVQRTVSSRLVQWLRDHGVSQIVLLASADLPLRVALERPDMVGIDRLLGAVSANVLRPHDTPAVVIDLGTAITVDMIAADGSFQGGAILPGIGLAAKALHEFTDLLPLLDMHSLAEPPTALGTNTFSAMRAGIYWGAIGGVRHLVDLLSAGLPKAPQVFLTGGAAPAVARLVAHSAVYAPHLVLSGIALAARK